MTLLDKLWQQYHVILEAEEITSPQSLKDILDSAVRVGFLVFEGGAYRLLPAVHRYLDLFQELAQAERLDQAQDEKVQDEMGAEKIDAFFSEETEEELR